MKLSYLKICGLLIGLPLTNYAQTLPKTSKNPVANWQMQSIKKDNVYGADVYGAYALLKNKKSEKIKVAVIDVGVDFNHPALSGHIWTNGKEIPDNGIDDDGNGYIDDLHGWNFLGSSTGNLELNNLEADREYLRMINSRDTANLTVAEKTYFRLLAKQSGLAEKSRTIQISRFVPEKVDEFERLFKEQFPDRPLTVGDMSKVKIDDTDLYLGTVANLMISRKKLLKVDDDFSFYKLTTIKKDVVKRTQEDYDKYYLSAAQNYRAIFQIPDTGKFYGNNQLSLASSEHGTHVAGIIAGQSAELKGISNAAEIIVVRSILMGDEYDIDVANGIRYAVDQGARIINMSFGKYFSPEKKLVDEAISYAESKNVLLVIAAGNVNKNLDTISKYPTATFNDGSIASNVITVGASDLNGKPADFSNYGKKTVDIYAPGVGIYSSILNNKYAFKNGTSMAAPVVSGIAALILSYYPDLKPYEIIALLKSTVSVPLINDQMEKGKTVKNSSVSGGIINACQAIQKLQSLNKL